MKHKEHEQPLLDEKARYWETESRSSISNKWVYITLVCLIASNAILLLDKLKNVSTVQTESSEFARLSYNTSTIYHTWSDFQDPELLNETWHNLDLTPIETILTDAEAKQHGVEPSKFRFPWDRSYGVYYVKAFHDLHCLKVIKWVVENPKEGSLKHVYHCLDALRQDIQCHADDTPMPITKLPDEAGEGQVRKCRDFGALTRWTQEPKRFPCYDRNVDFELEDRLEAYAFCPENSPFYSIQQAYFAKWGHNPT